MGMLASMLWPMVNVNASFSTYASMEGLMSAVGSEFVYDLDLFRAINLYDSMVNPITLSKPVHRELAGIYGAQSSIDSVDLSFNITATVADESRSFMYESLDDKAFGAAATSVLSTTFIMLQNLVNAGIQLALSLENTDMTSSQSASSSENSERVIALLLGLLGILFAVLNAIYFFFGSKLNGRMTDQQYR